MRRAAIIATGALLATPTAAQAVTYDVWLATGQSSKVYRPYEWGWRPEVQFTHGEVNDTHHCANGTRAHYVQVLMRAYSAATVRKWTSWPRVYACRGESASTIGRIVEYHTVWNRNSETAVWNFAGRDRAKDDIGWRYWRSGGRIVQTELTRHSVGVWKGAIWTPVTGLFHDTEEPYITVSLVTGGKKWAAHITGAGCTGTIPACQ